MVSKRYIVLILSCLAALFCLIINACRKSDVSRRTTPLNFVVPEGFPEPVYDFTANPVTEEGFQLGKKLFYDHSLSKGLDVSCGSCHQQLAAYTTFDHDLGHGTNNQHTTRNVPGIFNMAWQKEFKWDGSVSSLASQVTSCLEAGEKMGETLSGVISKTDTSSNYRQLFSDAFGDETITGDKIINALTQFVVMIVSADSKFDKVKRGEVQFNANEAAGYELFTTDCAGCHAEPLFTDLSYRNIGLPHRDFHEDAGRMLFTNSRNDSLKFKVPSLRNAGITSYYAHDGRFAGLSEVIEHYVTGVVTTPTTDPLLRNGLNLSDLEKFYLQEFLLTLSDSSIVNDGRFR